MIGPTAGARGWGAGPGGAASEGVFRGGFAPYLGANPPARRGPAAETAPRTRIVLMSLVGSRGHARALHPAIRAARPPRGRRARAGGGPARDLDRAARPRVLRARGRHRRLPGPRARRRARVLRAARRVRHGGDRRGPRRGPRAARARGGGQRHRARPRRGAGARRAAVERRLPLLGRGRPTAVREPPAHRPAGPGAGRRGERGRAPRHRRARAALARPRLRRRGRARPGAALAAARRRAARPRRAGCRRGAADRGRAARDGADRRAGGDDAAAVRPACSPGRRRRSRS